MLLPALLRVFCIEAQGVVEASSRAAMKFLSPKKSAGGAAVETPVKPRKAVTDMPTPAGKAPKPSKKMPVNFGGPSNQECLLHHLQSGQGTFSMRQFMREVHEKVQAVVRASTIGEPHAG